MTPTPMDAVTQNSVSHKEAGLALRGIVTSAVIYWVMSEKKVFDDTWPLSTKHGNGLLRREVWVNERGLVVRYNLAYVNRTIFSGDHGRVVGYDNAHGYHHRHYMGVVEPVEFVSFEDIEARFEGDWVVFRRKQR